MTVLLLLLSAHFIADFYIQPINHAEESKIKALKNRKLWQQYGLKMVLFISAIVAANLALITSVCAIFVVAALQLTSLIRRYYQPINLTNFLIEQSIKMIILIMLWAYIIDVSFAESMMFLEKIITAKNTLIALSYLLVCKPASLIISLALKKHTDELARVNEDNVEQLTSNKSGNIGLLSAGAWIGYIERCLAISFIFMGQFAGIGFLVATKTIFRFGDLTKNKDMKLTEYMMLGTLLSYAIAIFVGWNTMRIYYQL